MVEFIIIIIPIGCAAFLWFMADKRGLNTLFWAVMGALFGPFAIPFIFLAKGKNSNKVIKPDRRSSC